MHQSKEMIENPNSWLNKHLGAGFEETKTHLLSGYPMLQMRHFPTYDQHCSLTALASVFLYYARKGYEQLPDNREYLFRRIRSTARLRLIHIPRLLFIRGGTIPFLLDRLARSIWKHYGYPRGRARNHLFWQSGRRAAPFVLDELDNGHPLLLSISSGHYKKHTVTVIGYKIYERVNEDNEDRENEIRVFLRVNDHWTTRPRYVELMSMDPLYGGPFFEFCQIIPPPI